MPELSPYDRMLRDSGFEDNLALKNVARDIRTQLENAGALVYLSPDAAVLTVSKDRTHVLVKLNEGEQQNVRQWPFVLTHFIPDRKDPRGYQPSPVINQKYSPVLKSADEVKEELGKLFLQKND